MSTFTVGELPIYEARPEGDAVRGVVVIQEAFGVNDHIEDVCRRFASLGYHAVAPHLFHRSGDPIIAYDDVERLRVAGSKAAVPTEVVRYPEAGHGFHCDQRPGSYHEPSARDGWRRAVEWFTRYL